MKNFYTWLHSWPHSNERKSRKYSLEIVSIIERRAKWIFKQVKSSLPSPLIQTWMNTHILVKTNIRMATFCLKEKIHVQFQLLQPAQNLDSGKIRSDMVLWSLKTYKMIDKISFLFLTFFPIQNMQYKVV